MAMATRAYWLMGLLYPTAEVGRLFIWLLFLKTEIERNIYYREHKFLLKMHPSSDEWSLSRVKGGHCCWGLAWRGFPPVGTCKHPGVPGAPPARGHPCPAGRGFAPAGRRRWGRAWLGAGDVPSGGHQRLELPLVLLAIEVQAVHDLVLLFWWDEVLDDQVPERVTGREPGGAGAGVGGSRRGRS